MNNLNLYQSAIALLCADGYDILQVLFEDESIYFLANKFQESYQSGTQSVDFNEVTGINITEFLRNMTQTQDRIQFTNRFAQIIDQGLVMRMAFSKNTKWIKYSNAGTLKR